MKTTIRIALSTLFAASVSVAAPTKQTSLPMDKRDFVSTIGTDEAAKEWLRSWHKGEAYFTQAEYDFKVELESTTTKEANWLKKWSSNKIVVRQKGSFFGKALTKTFVYHEAPNLRMTRDYQHVLSDGTWGAKAMPRSKAMQDAIAKAVKDKDTIAKNVYNFGKEPRRAIYQIIQSMIDPDNKNPEIGETIETWGEAGWEITTNLVLKTIGKFDGEGRVNIGPDSTIGKALDVDEGSNVVAAAMAFSNQIEGRSLAIAQDGKYTRRIREIKNDQATDKNPADDVETFDSYFAKGSKPNKEIEALVKRESFSVSADLFDSEIRKPGDTWAIDATFFNSFLHPDLAGAFRGTAVIRYISDEEGDGAYFSAPAMAQGKPRSYNVRKLKVLPKATIDGSDVSTDFSYDETQRGMGGRFKANYDPKLSNIDILVDKQSGHVVYGKVNMYADNVEVLPSLKLLRGYKGSGAGSLILTFRGDVYFIKDFASEPAK